MLLNDDVLVRAISVYFLTCGWIDVEFAHVADLAFRFQVLSLLVFFHELVHSDNF